MKLFKDIALSMIPKDQPAQLVHCINYYGTLKFLEEPKMSDEITCPMCESKLGIHVYLEPTVSDKRLWFCGNPPCVKQYKMQVKPVASSSPKRAIEWPLFCERNELGDNWNQVTFESLDLLSKRKEFLAEYAKKPSGLLVFQGKPGRGKTYCALALCELLTRRSISCTFQSQKRMYEDWVHNQAMHNAYNHRERLTNVELLIIDDFGLIEPTPAFLSYLQDILDSRMQWSNKGTVITTNLDDEKLSKMAGEPLSDRIKTAQFLEFQGESRRKKKVI